LRQAGGNKVHAAEALGISRTTLRKKMDELGL
jgi:DNA-binding protein Fis